MICGARYQSLYLKQEAVTPAYLYVTPAISVTTMAANRYVPRCRNELHTIFERHFACSPRYPD